MSVSRSTSGARLVPAVIIALAAHLIASATVINFSETDSDGRAASAAFEVVGGNLQVKLANLGTKPSAKWNDTYVLTALFFNYTGPGTLAPNSGALGAVAPGWGGVIPSGLSSADQTIGSYWAYGSHLSGPHGATEGLLAVGFGIGQPAKGNMGPTGQLINGVDGGLLGWDDVSTANASVKGKGPFVYPSVTFTLLGKDLPDELDASYFSHLSFQYGTRLAAPNLAVPEPTTMIAGMLLLLPFGLSTLRMLGRKSMNRG